MGRVHNLIHFPCVNRYSSSLKHTTTLFFLCDRDNLSREWRVIVDQVQINNGRPMVLVQMLVQYVTEQYCA